MSHLSLYTWHAHESSLDEMVQLPEGTGEDDARAMALLKLQLDPEATIVEVLDNEQPIAMFSRIAA